MRDRNFNLLILILIIAGLAIWVVWPGHDTLKLPFINATRDISVRQGLDLQGGTQVLLEADVPATTAVSAESMQAARNIVENRVNGLGVTEPLVQLQGDRRIIVELPGIKDPDQAIATFRQTGLLEFIDAGSTFLQPGTIVKTTFGTEGSEPAEPSAEEPAPAETIYTTIMTGKDLKNADVGFDGTGKPMIQFELQSESASLFANYTAANVGKYLAIVLDKVVISCPIINSAIPDGQGVIEGSFTLEEARGLAIQLKYGALPVPLKIVDNRTIGATLGYDSVRRSAIAGVIGVVVVLLFMIVYYRLPGLMAALALVLYALLNFSVYKLIPVTLTLPGIAGFLLSTGMAVDANILIFERMKEEIRGGRSLTSALGAGFDRAWTSIRDSNISTLITCTILYIFGSNFGASIVKGFAITLAIGVMINLFTAITVTRTLLRTLFHAQGDKIEGKHWLLGV
jgi:protein-export membrane protein SecD